jgi:DNA-directed RNA polymerase subunit RPC12/RpoP
VAFLRHGLTKEENVVKFRCLHCSQKIAVNDDVCGVVIACPTCEYTLIIPPRSDDEFAVLPVIVDRAALMPHLARMLMDKLVQGLLHQRRQLLDSQTATADQLDVIEQRLALLHTKWKRRQDYEERITALEAENKDLRRQAELAVQPAARPARRVNLQAGLLLRA